MYAAIFFTVGSTIVFRAEYLIQIHSGDIPIAAFIQKRQTVEHRSKWEQSKGISNLSEGPNLGMFWDVLG